MRRISARNRLDSLAAGSHQAASHRKGSLMTDIAAALAAVRSEIAETAAARRDRDAVTLVAVSKTKPLDDIRAALAAGQRIFGENRVQEAMAKFDPLRAEAPR